MKPILFNTEMVRAILDGRKTVTRRVIKPQPTNPRFNNIGWLGWDDGHGYKMRQPYFPDDILCVRETFCETPAFGIQYRADWNDDACPYMDCDDRWRPSIHMPKEAARLFLRVTNVSVAKLQDITDEEAKAEGANWRNGKNVGCEDKMWRSAIERFAEIWNSTVKKADLSCYGWEANPWVWVIEFERISKKEAQKAVSRNENTLQ